MYWFYIVLGLLGGSALSIQVGVNAQLRRWIGSSNLAAFISFMVGTIALLIYCLATHSPWKGFQRMHHAPWWVWLGGILGAFYICITIIAGPRIGAAAFIGLAITGQFLTSLIIDHFGLLGFQVHHLNPLRIVGAVLLIAGVVLIQKF
ncbi:DMT family transporter [Thermoactinomyces sp. CICC 10522]|uniref:DMT family transporter n=1 Tax=Thermoactinomyces sp. CICC 10522 TaxID=2767427 RepID=UPI0018DC0CDC|nr:DMT family transporter [Thermoactinomyces sp. CICC 10522]